MPTVTVIVLCFNHREDTLACLASLFSDPGRDFDVLVVDNASSDGTAEAVAGRFPEAELIRLPENRGWAGGNNVGLGRALERGAEFVCLLNNDTVIPFGAIQRLAATAREQGPCLVNPAIDYADAAQGTQLDPSTGVTEGTPVPGQPGLYRTREAYGACLMVPASLLRALGGFDERFFLQLEETDLVWRARKLGAPSLCDTRVRIVHAESVSFGGRTTPAKTYYIVRNTLLLTEKHHRGPRRAAAALRSLWWTIANHHRGAGGSGSVLGTLRWLGSGDDGARAIRHGLADYMLRRFGPGRGQAFRRAAPGSGTGT